MTPFGAGLDLARHIETVMAPVALSITATATGMLCEGEMATATLTDPARGRGTHGGMGAAMGLHIAPAPVTVTQSIQVVVRAPPFVAVKVRGMLCDVVTGTAMLGATVMGTVMRFDQAMATDPPYAPAKE